MVATTAPAVAVQRQQPWLRSQQWDYAFIIGSVVLVAIPVSMHYGLGISTRTFDLLVAALIGGPHMYATFTLTFWEGSAWKRQPLYLAGALGVGVTVVVLSVVNLSLLITIFMAWASFHVLQQIAFLADCYRGRAGESMRGSSRLLDYAVLFTSLYPVAVYKLANDGFHVGGQEIYRFFPVFLKNDTFIYLVWGGFALMLGAWLLKTGREYVENRLNQPKTVLIGVTIAVSFAIPVFDNLDVAFQGMNMWHSLQYVALLWWVNCIRHEQGQIGSRVVRKIAGRGRTGHFYGFHVLLTIGAGGLIMGVYWLSGALGWGLGFQQCYFMVVLSFLLMHYYFDTVMFARPQVVIPGFPGLGRIL
jgi:hypothetical protein